MQINTHISTTKQALERMPIELAELAGLVVDHAIEAIAKPEFEDGLRKEVLPGGYWCHWYVDWSWGQCGCHVVPCQTRF